MKLIIVDDEMLIRKLIRMKLDLERLGIEVVGEYADAKSALEGIVSLRPDIVLSDICMPGEDGISFSEKCVEINPDIKVIIITGFNDFEYARRSIKAGVFDYLMKPVQAEELNNTVEKACDEIRQIRSRNEQNAKLREELETNLRMLRKAYINEQLLKETADSDIANRLEEFGVETENGDEGGLLVGILTVREVINNPRLPVLMENEVEEFFASEKFVSIVNDSWGRVIVISSSSEFPMKECLGMVTNVIVKKYGCHISYAVSERFDGWKDIHKAYLSALGELQSTHSDKSEGEVADSEIKLNNIPELSCEDVVKLINQGQIEAARERISSALFDQDKSLSVSVLKQKVKAYIRALRTSVAVDGVKRFNGEYEYFNTPSELEWWVNAQLIPILVYKKNSGDNDELIRDIVIHIFRNLDNPDMNQNTLAGDFSISSSHMSRLFKQCLGRTYVGIVTDFRLLRMVTLLNTTNMKDRDIGIEIGIPDAHYLSIWFRKITGMTVSEYRKMLNKCQKSE